MSKHHSDPIQTRPAPGSELESGVLTINRVFAKRDASGNWVDGMVFSGISAARAEVVGNRVVELIDGSVKDLCDPTRSIVQLGFVRLIIFDSGVLHVVCTLEGDCKKETEFGKLIPEAVHRIREEFPDLVTKVEASIVGAATLIKMNLLPWSKDDVPREDLGRVADFLADRSGPEMIRAANPSANTTRVVRLTSSVPPKSAPSDW